MSEPKKPLLMRREEFIAELGRVINGYELPPVLIEPILRDYLKDVEAAMTRQYNKDVAEYNRACEEARKTPGPGGGEPPAEVEEVSVDGGQVDT